MCSKFNDDFDIKLGLEKTYPQNNFSDLRRNNPNVLRIPIQVSLVSKYILEITI